MSFNVTNQLLRINRNLIFAAKKHLKGHNHAIDFQKFNITENNAKDQNLLLYNIEELTKILAHPEFAYLSKFRYDPPKTPPPRINNFPQYD